MDNYQNILQLPVLVSLIGIEDIEKIINLIESGEHDKAMIMAINSYSQVISCLSNNYFLRYKKDGILLEDLIASAHLAIVNFFTTSKFDNIDYKEVRHIVYYEIEKSMNEQVHMFDSQKLSYEEYQKKVLKLEKSDC